MAAKPTSPPPAYFLSLSLENVRSFGEKQTISFARKDGRPAQWTIILGDNGVGKTTVLKSLAALRPSKASLPNSPEETYTPAYFTGLQRTWIPIRGTEGTLGQMFCSYTKNKMGHLHTLTDDNYAEVGFLQDKENGRVAGGSSIFSEDDLGFICYGYGAGRTTGNSTLSETPETVDTCASLFDDRADLLNPEEWFLFADYRMAKDKDPLTTQNFNLIKAALLKIMEEGEVTDLEVAPVQSGNGGSPRQGVRFKTPYGWVRLRDMSLGYQTLVVWLTDLADKLFVRYPNSKNPLAEPAIILIDEIDLHLHPSWQRNLIKSLSEIFVNTQFIATAHSPLVVQAATDAEANVVLLKREDDQTIVHQNTEDVRGWRLDQILTSELFGLETARSLDTEHKLKRRAELLTNTSRTATENQELAALTRELNAEPVGETPSEREVNSVLQELRQRLRQQDAPAA